MGLTQWFSLRKPTDPQEPADLITIVGALADDTDAVLKAQLATKADTGHGHAGLDAGVRGDINALLTFRNSFRSGGVAVPIANNATSGAVDVTFSSPLAQGPRVVATVVGSTFWIPFVSAITASGCRITLRCVNPTSSGTASIAVHYIAVAGLG
jgi:hypothetical protein